MCSVVSPSLKDGHNSDHHSDHNNQLERRRGRRHRRRYRRCGGGATRLMYAAQQGDVDRVRSIVRSQPFLLFDRDRTGKSALHYCCTSENICASQAADLLVMAAPDLVESRDEDGFTPLHLAVIAGNTQLVTFLLANGANVSAVDNEKHTVVHWATVCGETSSLRAVLAAGAPVSTPDVHGGYPLHYAAQMCGGKDFHLGLQVLQILLSHKDIKVSVEDGDKRQPLLWAASAGSSKALLALVRAGGSVESYDKDGLTALHCAASRGHTDCIDTLLTLCGASPDIIDSNGCTSLHYAVTLGHADATALLLSHGADPNRQDRKGRSPAHCGCAKGQFETLKLLASRGANLWLRNARGDLPLHEAASSGRRELVSWLLNMRPSQVNAKNNDGRTPLHMAALNDNTDMCKILLDSGAQINPVLRTSKNIFMTPLDCALQRGFRSTAKFLQLNGGLPASRLGSQSIDTQRSSSVVSFPIREDMTFDTSSESADEKISPEKSISSKTYVRRKPKSKSKSKVTISGSDSDVRKTFVEKSKPIKMADQKTQTTSSIEEQVRDAASRNSSWKPMSSKIDYTNEIIINGKTEVTIHQEKEITLDQEGNVLISPRVQIDETITIPARSSSGDREKRPRSAKYLKKSATTASKSPTEKSELESRKATPDTEMTKKISFEESEVTAEVKPLKSALKQSTTKTSNDTELMSERIAGNTATNELSNTSEDQEEPKNIIVEAAVHPQPNVCLTPDTVISQESKTNRELIQTDEGHAEILRDLEKKQVIDLSDQTDIKESAQQEQIFTEGTTTSPVEQKKQRIQDHLKTENANEQQLSKDDSCYNKESKIDAERRDLKTSNLTKETKASTDSVQEEPTNKKANDQKQEEQIEMKSFQSKLTDEKQGAERISDTLIDRGKIEMTAQLQKAGDIPINIIQKSEKIKHEIILDTQKDEYKEESREESPKIDNVELVDVSKRVKDGLGSKKSKTINDKRSKDITAKPTNKEADKEKFKEKIPKTEVKKAAKSRMSKEGVKEKKDSTYEKQNIPFSSEEESIVSPMDYSDSLIDEKNHKSFKVLSDKEAKKMVKIKTKSKIQPPKSQSISGSKDRGLLEPNLKRSKIPTPTFTTPLSKSDRQLDKIGIHAEKMESRVPSLPNIHGELSTKDHQHYRSYSNMSVPNIPAAVYSDKERGTDSELDEQREISSPTRRKKVKRKSRLRHRESRSAGSDYESSNVIDSGFEPSPRSTRIPKWRNMSNRGVVMTSVTRSIQSNIRRYHLERKIFQHLLELKRSQIRADQHNEQVLVKRAIDQYNQSCASTVGAGRYVPKDLSFKSFEKFLYESLRNLQKMDVAYLKGLPANSEHVNPLLCTQSTHRCMHATHAYTGIPCAAYLPKMDHHSIPKIGFTSSSCKPGTAGFLPKIDGKKTVTLELSHGADKQIISLPTDRLDQNKRYYVTFTVKGHDPESSLENGGENATAHIHAKSD